MSAKPTMPLTKNAFANAKATENSVAVPAVALQKFLHLISTKKWEASKALAFQSALRSPISPGNNMHAILLLASAERIVAESHLIRCFFVHFSTHRRPQERGCLGRRCH